MTIVAVLGDVATTTTLALAAAWPADREPVVVEWDPSGGSVGAWCDLAAGPTLSTVVTRAADGGWPVVESLAHRTASGLTVIPAPFRWVEASLAVAEAEHRLVGVLAADETPLVIADLGSPVPARGLSTVVPASVMTVVVHRQSPQSSRAAAARIERLAELVDAVVATGVPWMLAVVGSSPFDPDEVVRFVADPHVPEGGVPPMVVLPDDPLAAAVLAGRQGVSVRRYARLPLPRAAATLAAVVDASVRSAAHVLGGSAAS